jgi:hypothetical protein
VGFSHFEPLKHPDDATGTNIDDRMGKFIKSRAHVAFRANALPKTEDLDEFEKKALLIVNSALRAIRYKAYDPAIRHVARFDKCVVRIIELNPDGTVADSDQHVNYKDDLGPFGIKSVGVLTHGALGDVWYYFNELARMHPSWFLVLDSKYHNAIGDISRACLDLAVALDINIDELINYYGNFISDLSSLNLDDKTIYWKYTEGLSHTTGHSLHERPDLFINLEYIYGIRNSIAHDWKPRFKISGSMLAKSKYLAEHKEKDGHEITDSREVKALINATEEIIEYTVKLFDSKFS